MARILTVEDEATLQDLYEAVLGIAGHELTGQAFDGGEGVSLFTRQTPRPDLVIMDYRMPGVDGLEASAAIRALDPAARILFVSADPSVREAAKACGAVGFLAKPFALSEFLAVLKELLGDPNENSAADSRAASAPA